MSRAAAASMQNKNGAASLAAKNYALYERSSVARIYAREPSLLPVERVIFERYRRDYVGRSVLDLGVGGGRTAPWLAPDAASYVGIDYSEKMVRAAQARFPTWDFRVGDARVMAGFDPESFDFILFALNGIDSVDHADRTPILRRAACLLKPGGVLVFSSHNLDAPAAPASLRSIMRIGWSIDPVRLAKNVVGGGLSLFNYARNARKHFQSDDYAILTDPSHRCQFLNYYIGADAQRRQLAEAGLAGPVEVFSEDGARVDRDTNSHFLYYVTRKP